MHFLKNKVLPENTPFILSDEEKGYNRALKDVMMHLRSNHGCVICDNAGTRLRKLENGNLICETHIIK